MSSIDTMLDAADQAMKDGRWADVVHLATTVQKTDPENARAQMLLTSVPPLPADAAPPMHPGPQPAAAKAHPALLGAIILIAVLGISAWTVIALRGSGAARSATQLTPAALTALIYQNEFSATITAQPDASPPPGASAANTSLAYALWDRDSAPAGTITLTQFSDVEAAQSFFRTATTAITTGGIPIADLGDETVATLADPSVLVLRRCTVVVLASIPSATGSALTYAIALDARLKAAICP